MSIKQNIDIVQEKIKKAALSVNRDPKEIAIVAVSKNVSCDSISEAIDAGISQFGESRVQEFLGKYDRIEEDINWHLIGSLQRNKVKYILDKVELIHSLDRLSLAREINKRAEKIDKKVQALVQVNMSREDTKSGVYEEELYSFIKKMEGYPNIEIKGLMTIGPLTDDKEAIRACFHRFRNLFEELSLRDMDNIEMKYLSMGMSKDYEIAVEEGSNMVRVGRAIFKGE